MPLNPLPVPNWTQSFCLVEAIYQVLNISKPEVTQSCWLCLDSRPLFYDGIALVGNFSTETDSSKCGWSQGSFERAPRVTLQALTGQGLCVATNRQLPYPHFCSQTLNVTFKIQSYLVAPPNTWWACKTGITACIHADTLRTHDDVCILVQLITRIVVHGED